MIEEAPEIEVLPLGGPVACDGMTIHVEIFRPVEGDERWTLDGRACDRILHRVVTRAFANTGSTQRKILGSNVRPATRPASPRAGLNAKGRNTR